MPVLQNSESIAAGATVDVLEGQIASTIPVNARAAAVRFAFTGSAVGLEAEAWVGGDNVIERGGVSTQNRMPIEPDDVVDRNIPAVANQQLRLKITNTTGGALTIFYRVTADLAY